MSKDRFQQAGVWASAVSSVGANFSRTWDPLILILEDLLPEDLLLEDSLLEDLRLKDLPRKSVSRNLFARHLEYAGVTCASCHAVHRSFSRGLDCAVVFVVI